MNIEELKRLAEAGEAANPAAVLELIAEVEYLRGKNREHFDACIGCDEELKRVTKQRDELLAALVMMYDSARQNYNSRPSKEAFLAAIRAIQNAKVEG